MFDSSTNYCSIITCRGAKWGDHFFVVNCIFIYLSLARQLMVSWTKWQVQNQLYFLVRKKLDWCIAHSRHDANLSTHGMGSWTTHGYIGVLSKLFSLALSRLTQIRIWNCVLMRLIWLYYAETSIRTQYLWKFLGTAMTLVNHTTSIRLQHITMFLVTLLNKHKFITQWKCFQNIQVSNLFISLFILLLSLNLCTCIS